MKYLFLLISLIIGMQVSAQEAELFVNAGPVLTKYNGELGSFDNSSGGIQIGLQFNKKEKLNGSLNFGFGAVSGEDINFGPQAQVSTEPNPNNFFKSNFIFFHYELHYNFIKKDNYQIYFSQGAGVFRFNPRNDLDEDLQDLTETRNEGEAYRNATIMLPTSIGATYFLPNDYGIGLQTGFYNTITKYLDNIGELGDNSNDNVLFVKLSVYAPLK
ncbi:MAG: hypothetical protein AAFN93_10985 [Bacteroidota bacterium]